MGYRVPNHHMDVTPNDMIINLLADNVMTKIKKSQRFIYNTLPLNYFNAQKELCFLQILDDLSIYLFQKELHEVHQF